MRWQAPRVRAGSLYLIEVVKEVVTEAKGSPVKKDKLVVESKAKASWRYV